MNRAERIALIGHTIRWFYKGQRYDSPVESMCPKCGALAVIELPPALRAAQPDDTTHVCHPSAGGCNHGFSNLPEGANDGR